MTVKLLRAFLLPPENIFPHFSSTKENAGK